MLEAEGKAAAPGMKTKYGKLLPKISTLFVWQKSHG
jgi:hypothetical protein